jgi:ABC-type oligopeptide transport system substrate-binding subunit
MIGARALLAVSLLVGVLVGAWALGAKHSANSGGEEQALTYQYIAFKQLDPQRVSDGAPVAGQNLLEGMVTPDAAGTGVLPATADTWTESQNGSVYTFHIRKDARWSDGTPVTARDFEWTYKRLLTPSTSALDTLYGSSSYQTDLGIKNAAEFQVGKITDWSRVGVKALDASHLQITLETPSANFLEGMAHTSMVPLPEKNLAKFPYAWETPAHWVGNGPFVMKSWTPNARMVLVPNEHYWDRQHVRLDRVNISMGQLSDAQVRSRYQHNEIDIAQLNDPTGFEKDPALSQALTRLDQFSVNFLTLIKSRKLTLEDVRVREAIALAIGRAEIANAGPLAKPSTSLVPSTLPEFDAGVGFHENIARARKLLAKAGYPGGKGFPTFSVMTDHNDPYVRAAVRTLQQNLGIRAVQDAEEPGVESAKRHEVQPASYVGYFSTAYTGILTWQRWVSNLYPPAQTQLLSLKPDDYTRYQVLQAHGTARSLAAADHFLDAHASPQSRRFAAVTARADATANPGRATGLYKQAAAIRQATYEFIPYAYGALVYAIRPGVKGVHLWTGYFTISFKGVSVSR